MRSQPTLGIIADDLTGANDTLVQFAEAGFHALLSLAGPETGRTTTPAESAVLASVTDARPLDVVCARTRSREAVEHLTETGINHLYVKIDSTMRGSIAGQIAGALDAWGGTHPDPFAVVCPAYPAMGRVVDDGRLLVNGKPVELSPAGTDPVTPVSTSEMADLLPGAVRVSQLSRLLKGERAQALSAAADESAVVIVDAVTSSDLEVLAGALLEIGPRAVPVGSAGLAAALAAQWAVPGHPRAAVPGTNPGRTLVVMSSLHDVSREQAQLLIESTPGEELLALQPPMDALRTPARAEAWLETMHPAHGLPPTVLIVSPTRAPASEETQPNGAGTSTTVAAGLAALTAALMERQVISKLVLMGGDGARAVLQACGAESVTILGAVQEGVPLGVVNGGRADGIHTVTKAGGFGQPETLMDILKTLTHRTSTPTEASS